MSSKHQDFLAQYYGDTPQETSDFEKRPKKKKNARHAPKPIQGLKLLDDIDTNEDFEEFTPIIPKKSTRFKHVNDESFFCIHISHFLPYLAIILTCYLFNPLKKEI